jgi:hypothetical protein
MQPFQSTSFKVTDKPISVGDFGFGYFYFYFWGHKPLERSLPGTRIT